VDFLLLFSVTAFAREMFVDVVVVDLTGVTLMNANHVHISLSKLTHQSCRKEGWRPLQTCEDSRVVGLACVCEVSANKDIVPRTRCFHLMIQQAIH